ncbi:hypothetical protein BLAT2472_80128 [Burkholderia latens]
MFFGRHRRSPVDAASRRHGMLRCARAGARSVAVIARAHCRCTAANSRGADSFLEVRRHTNTGNITYSSHSNDPL